MFLIETEFYCIHGTLHTDTICCYSLVPAVGGELRTVQLMFKTIYEMVLKKKYYCCSSGVEMVFKRSTGTWRNFPPYSALSPR